MPRALKHGDGIHRTLGADDTLLSHEAQIELRLEDELEEIRSDVREIRLALSQRAPKSERISKRLETAAQRTDQAHDSVRGLRRRK